MGNRKGRHWNGFKHPKFGYHPPKTKTYTLTISEDEYEPLMVVKSDIGEVRISAEKLNLALEMIYDPLPNAKAAEASEE